MARQDPKEEVNAALAALIGRPEAVLDVGCGTGMNGMVARTTGARVTGLEHDPVLAKRAGLLLDEVFELDPTDPAAVARALGERRFDLVLIPDLIERCARPADVVQAFAKYVAPEGRLIVSARNREVWPVKLGLANESIGFEESHRLFSRAEVEAFVRAAGLSLLQVDVNPMLVKAARRFLDESTFVSAKYGEAEATGYRDLSVWQMYLSLVRPVEVALTRLAPRVLAYQHVVVARRPPEPRKLALTIGMLTMDEEESIARMIDEIRRVAPDAKILVVDSSVKDQTPIIAEKMGARVLRQLPPRGHGPAMELLMYESAKQGDALIYLDCDFTYPPEVIPVIRRILESGVDVVNATRIRVKPEAMPLPNFMANRTFVYFSRVLNGVPLSDLHSGMRGYRSSAIRAFSFTGEGDALPIDTIVWPARSGYHVVEVPIDYQERVGTSKLRKLAGTVWTFIRLAKTVNVGTRRRDTYDVWESLDEP
ncbi:MAG: methyltransferase domain-containing protein [Myxococcales bacterium]|nr:methyltransferase domain-containing protein [Myxococcales bacterium]